MSKAMHKTMRKSFLGKRETSNDVLNDAVVASKQLFQLNLLQDLKPSSLAAIIQCLAFVTALLLFQLLNALLADRFKVNSDDSIVTLIILQSILACTFSYYLSMAIWWRWIHLCFPIAALAMTYWQLPNEIYLVGFIVTLSLFWTTFRSQVPFFPSRPVVWKQVAKMMPKDSQLRLIDIGSGLGDMSMYISKVRPDCNIEGIEIAPLPWLISVLRAKLSRSKATFKLGDYHALDFADYDIVFAYLSPAAMLMLWKKASKEMIQGSLLISLEFEIPGIQPSMKIAANENSPAMYVWRI